MTNILVYCVWGLFFCGYFLDCKYVYRYYVNFRFPIRFPLNIFVCLLSFCVFLSVLLCICLSVCLSEKCMLTGKEGIWLRQDYFPLNPFFPFGWICFESLDNIDSFCRCWSRLIISLTFNYAHINLITDDRKRMKL